MADNPDSSDGLPTADLTPAAAVDALEPKSEPGVKSEPGPAKPKQTLGLKIHVDNDSADYDVIAVHGIHGDATAWGIDKSSLETTNDCWLPARFENARLMTFNYETNHEKGQYYTRLGVEEEATSLLRALQQHRQGVENRPIVFVTHDIGGLIVKAALASSRSHRGDFQALQREVNTLITFGYPHVSARSATCDLTEEFVLLVNLRSELFPRSRVRRIAASLAETCVEVNGDFIHAGVVVRTRIISIASQHKDERKRVFGASTVCFGKSLEHDITSNEPHLDLIKLGTTGPGALKEAINADWKAPGLEEDQMNQWFKFSSGASPVFPLAHLDSQLPFAAQDPLDKLLASKSSQILHIQCDETIAASISDALVTHIRNHKRDYVDVLHFRFDSTDLRFNNVGAWLRTLISTMAFYSMSNRNYCATLVADQLKALHTWGAKDLYSYLEDYLLFRGTATYIVILANFDECDDSSLAFLDQLRLTFSKTERKLRFVVTTSTGADERLLEALPKAAPNYYERVQLDGTSAINNSSSGQSGSENTTDIAFQLSMFFQRHPQYTTDNIKHQIKDVITVRYKDRPDLRTHITGWLSEQRGGLQNSGVREWLATLAAAKPTAEAVYRAILSSLPQRQHSWARIIFTWVLTTVRPLKIKEFLFLSDLATAMTHAEDGQGELSAGSFSGGKYGLSDLQQLRVFGGLVEERNGEIRLVNRSIRRWLLSELDQNTTPDDGKEEEGREWYACLGTEVQRHLSIVKFCLDFLTTFKSDAPLKALGYASQHWATHYKLARSLDKEAIESIHAEISIFFEDVTAWGAWWQTYSELADRLHTLDQVETRLQIAAHLGLDDFVESFKDGVILHSTSYRQAFVQAAEMGHLESLRLLLPPNGAQFEVGLHDVNIQEYAEAAARGGGECLREVIGRIPKEDLSDMEERPFLYNILGRAAWDGLDDVIRLIGDPGPYTDQSSDCTFLPRHSPLSLAVRRYHPAAVQAFLDVGVKADVSCCDYEGGRGVPAVNMAADYGSDEALALLLENGAVVNTGSDWTAIQGAADWGQHAIVKMLAAHSPYRDYITSGGFNDPVIRTAENGYLKTFEAAFVPGVDVNLTSTTGTLIYHAVFGENIEICRLLLSKGADANMSTALGRTPLGRAALDNLPEIAELLLNHGAEINKACTLPDIAGTVPPLYVAVEKRHKEMVALLLAHKADPNAQTSDGLSALCAASTLGDVDLISQLVAAGAEVNMACASKKTALHLAVKHPEAVRALMKHGADLRRTADGFTPLDLAVEQNTETTAVQIMLEESPEKPDFSLATFRSTFAGAMRAGKHEIVRLLFEAGVDVNQDCDHPTGLSLLSLAVLSNHVDAVRMVLEFRPDLHNGNVDGDTPLHCVTESGPVEIARLLVNAGCALDALNKKGNSPLSNAVKRCNLAVVKYMLTKPSALRTLDLVGGDNSIPLHLACRYADVEMVAILLSKGADPNLRSTGTSGTPLMSACVRKGYNPSSPSSPSDSEAIIRHLVSKNAIVTLPAGRYGFALNAASSASSPGIIQLFLDNGADINGADPMGRRPVHMACYNSLDALRALNVPTEHFAIKDKLGRLPLHYAVLSGLEDLLEEVLSRSADAGVSVDEADNDGWTPLLWAARAMDLWCHQDRDSSALVMVRMLLEKGADADVRGEGLYENKNWSAREIAIYHGADEAAELLASMETPATARVSQSRRRGAIIAELYCDVCELKIRGVYFQCTTCDHYKLCFKCYRAKDAVHPNHDFSDKGYDHDPDVEESDSETKPAINGSPTSEKLANEIGGGDDHDEAFDDEVVSDDEGDVSLVVGGDEEA